MRRARATQRLRIQKHTLLGWETGSKKTSQSRRRQGDNILMDLEEIGWEGVD